MNYNLSILNFAKMYVKFTANFRKDFTFVCLFCIKALLHESTQDILMLKKQHRSNEKKWMAEKDKLLRGSVVHFLTTAIYLSL